MIVALDPSSSCIGCAVLADDGQLQLADLIKPTSAKDPVNQRLETMTQDLRELIVECRVKLAAGEKLIVVIEDTSGKVGRNRHAGRGAGLAVYGKAVGWFIAFLKYVLKVELVTVLENDWTRGKSKQERTGWIIAKHKNYDAAKDPGGDIADAIGLGDWYLTERKLEEKTHGKK